MHPFYLLILERKHTLVGQTISHLHKKHNFNRFNPQNNIPSIYASIKTLQTSQKFEEGQNHSTP